VIFIGDGVPTWGELEPAALGALAEHIGAPIDAALLGKGATTALWGELAGRTGGRAMIVRSHLDEQRFALGATTAGLPRLTSARVVIAGASSSSRPAAASARSSAKSAAASAPASTMQPSGAPAAPSKVTWPAPSASHTCMRVYGARSSDGGAPPAHSSERSEAGDSA
jgi:hypothetical protein